MTYKIRSTKDGVERNVEDEFHVDDAEAFAGSDQNLLAVGGQNEVVDAFEDGLRLVDRADGLTVPFINKTSRFTTDPDFEGFLGGLKDDPIAGTEGTNSSARMILSAPRTFASDSLATQAAARATTPKGSVSKFCDVDTTGV